MIIVQFPVDDCRCGCRSISKCGRTNGQGRSDHLVDDFPRHAANAALSRVGDLVVGVGREVEIAVGTCLAPVGQLNVDDLAPDWNGQQGSAGPERERGVLRTGNFGSLAAHGVLIGVAARVTAVGQRHKELVGNPITGRLTGTNRRTSETRRQCRHRRCW